MQGPHILINFVARRFSVRCQAFLRGIAFGLIFAWLSVAIGRAETTVIAVGGDSLPDGPGQFNLMDRPVLSGTGQVLFQANSLQSTPGGTDDDTGIYLYDGAALVKVARENDLLPEGNGRFDTLFGPSINASSTAGFGAQLRDTSGATPDNNGLYQWAGGTLVNIAREGTPPYDDAASNSFSVLELSDGAYSAFLHRVSPGQQFIYRHDGNSPMLVAQTGMTEPENNGQFEFMSTPTVPSPTGKVVFDAVLSNTSGGTSDNVGIFLYDGSALVNLVRAGDPDPAGNGEFDGWFTGNFFMSASGSVVFNPLFRNTSGGTSDNVGVYMHNGAALVKIARSGDTAPEGNGDFDFFSDAIPSAAGHVVFNATLENTSGGMSDNQGLYRYDNGILVNLLRSGMPEPDGNGVLIGSFGPNAVNDHGVVVFRNALGDTSGGTLDDRGLYLTDGIETVKVARKNDALAGSTATDVRIRSNSDDLDAFRDTINNFGQVAYWASLANGKQGVFLFTPELRWRSTTSGAWDTAGNWTLGLEPGAPHDVTIDPADDLTVTGPGGPAMVRSLQIGGAVGIATLSLQSGGTLTVAEGLTIETGGVLAGNGLINGSVQNDGVVSPGTSVGALNITGNYTQSGSGTLRIELTSATSYDELQLSGDLAAGGALEISLIGDYTPTVGAEFRILGFSSVSDPFDTVSLPGLDGPLAWDTSQLYDSGVISVVLPGDFNLDGVVDTADYVMWRKNGGTQPHYNTWQTNFGESASGNGGLADDANSLSGVPEPASAVLFVFGLTTIWLSRRASS